MNLISKKKNFKKKPDFKVVQSIVTSSLRFSLFPLWQAFYGIFDGHGGTRAAEFAAKNMARHVMEEVVKHGEEEVLEAIKIGYLTTDMEFEKEGVRGGACCVTALIRNGNLIVSNAGDCRAVLSRGGVAEALTLDHRPSRDDERDRLQKLVSSVLLISSAFLSSSR